VAGSGQAVTAEPPIAEAPPAPGRPGRFRRNAVALAFLAPAIVLLGIWVIYPTVYTIVRSLFDNDGSTFVWFDNYVEIFTRDTTIRAIKNNAIWVAVVPALVSAIGLIFAVLTERVRWSVAFKVAVFMPMAISLFATGVIWRIMYEKDPDRGAVNAVVAVVHDWIEPPGAFSNAFPSIPQLTGSASDGFVLQRPLQPGRTALLPLVGMPTEEVPADAKPAAPARPRAGAITGTVYRDFRPGGGGRLGAIDRGEVGLSGVSVQLRDAGGKLVRSATSADDGAYEFERLDPGTYRVGIGSGTFAKPFGGVSWLGAKLITPSIIISYLWVWVGFALVVIAAGLAAIPRDVLEAARTDGATEWQVFRRVTAPLLAPVLSVVFITMIINVLKVFDIVISVAPGSVQDDANVLALSMWRTSFGGTNEFGVGAAIAVFLFLLVIPVLALNVRRFKREV
jgi:alpha-glucoside transport system permease protein